MREIGIPSRMLVENKERFYKQINFFNGVKTIYYSLYDFNTETKYNGCMIDKIHFDLDKDDAIECVKKLHNYCKHNNIKHLMIFSGRRYQFYIFTQNYKSINNRKDCLRNAQHEIANKVGLTIGDPANCDIDFHLIGDIARLVRVPNTMHLKTNLYCIPISEDDITNGDGFIRRKAKKQNFSFIYYCTGLFDLSRFDYESKIIQKIDYPADGDLIETEEIAKGLPLCILRMLNMPYIPWRNRFHIIVYLRESGYSLSMVYKLFEKYMKGKKHPQTGHDNFYHCVKDEGDQIKRIYETSEYFFSCRKVAEEGWCNEEKCKKKIYI